MSNKKNFLINCLGTTNTYKGEQVGSMAYYAKKAEERKEAYSFQEFIHNNYECKVIKTVEESEDEAIDSLLNSGFNDEYLDYLLNGGK